MKWFARKRNIIGVTLTDTEINLSWVTQKSHQLCVRAAEQHQLINNEIYNSVIFNYAHLQKIITNFITTHTIKRPQLCIGLSGAGLFETTVTLSTQHATKDHFTIPELDQLWWHFTYQGSTDNLHHYYVCGIKPALLFSYQLLCILCNVECKLIIPRSMALQENNTNEAFGLYQIGTTL